MAAGHCVTECKCLHVHITTRVHRNDGPIKSSNTNTYMAAAYDARRCATGPQDDAATTTCDGAAAANVAAAASV